MTARQFRWFRFLIILMVLVGVAGAVILLRLADHDLDRRTSETFAFSAGGNSISGTLWLPEGTPQAAIAVVHGDGPQDRTSDGGYAPFINSMLDAGIAVASWDKAGIGASGGDWLGQSMDDRADEVRAALAKLSGRLPGKTVGALGFSQAGWVLPRLSAADTDFIVLVGPAVSWRDQGAYYMRKRLTLAGADAASIETALKQREAEDERLFGAGARYDRKIVPPGISKARWGFIQRNNEEDARSRLTALDMPVLALWGADDLNVDAQGDSAIYRAALADFSAENEVDVIPDATHGLLKASPYNVQLVSDMSLWAKLRFIWDGRQAYAPGVLDRIATWIAARSGQEKSAQ